MESVFLYAQKKIALKNQRVNIAQNNRVGVAKRSSVGRRLHVEAVPRGNLLPLRNIFQYFSDLPRCRYRDR